MHFPIIAIESLETEKADFVRILSYEDSILNDCCDYYGRVYDEKEREVAIKSEWLKELFDGVATIDEENETITFLDKDTIKNTIQDYLIRVTEDLHDKAIEGELTLYDLRCASKEYKEFSTLFYFDGCGHSSFGFIEEASYYCAGETFKIGNIFDAHF